MKVVVLYSELAGYFLACIRAFAEQTGAEVHIFHWPVHKDAPFQFDSIPGIRFYERMNYDETSLAEAVKGIQPDLIYLTGWMDKAYLPIGKHFKRQGKPVICALDNQWHATMRQRLACLLSPFFLKPSVTNLWVPGPYQFTYARKLGFRSEQIRTGVYAADTAAFERVFNESLAPKQAHYPKKFLFVGRFVSVKGLQELIPAFQQLRKEGCDWELELVGTGEMKASLAEIPGIRLRDFVQPAQLPELARTAGAFVLPSRFEPWGVVLHEFAAAGLPIIASDACGAATAFVRDGQNGFLHRAGDPQSLTDALRKIWQSSPTELLSMGHHSVELSRTLSPQTWASTLQTFLPQ